MRRDSYLPRVAQRDHMVDIDIAGSGPRGAVIGTEPCSRGGSAGRILDDIGAVAFKNHLPGVTGT